MPTESYGDDEAPRKGGQGGSLQAASLRQATSRFWDNEVQQHTPADE